MKTANKALNLGFDVKDKQDVSVASPLTPLAGLQGHQNTIAGADLHPTVKSEKKGSGELLGYEVDEEGKATSFYDEAALMLLSHEGARIVDEITKAPYPSDLREVYTHQNTAYAIKENDYYTKITKLLSSRHPGTSVEAATPDLMLELLYEVIGYNCQLVTRIAATTPSHFSPMLKVYGATFPSFAPDLSALPVYGELYGVAANPETMIEIKRHYESLYKPPSQIRSSDKIGVTDTDRITSAYQSFTFVRARAWEMVAMAINQHYATILQENTRQMQENILRVQPNRNGYFDSFMEAERSVKENLLAKYKGFKAVALDVLSSKNISKYSQANVHTITLVNQFQYGMTKLVPNIVKEPEVSAKNYRKHSCLSMRATIKYLLDAAPDSDFKEGSESGDIPLLSDRVATMLATHASSEVKFFYTPAQLLVDD